MKKIMMILTVVLVTVFAVTMVTGCYATPRPENGVITYLYSSNHEEFTDEFKVKAGETTENWITFNTGDFKLKLTSKDCKFVTILPDGREFEGCIASKDRQGNTKFKLRALDTDQKIEMTIDWR